MKKENADRSSGWRPAGGLSLAGDRRKAALIAGILGGLFFLVASSWVVVKAVERKEGYRFRQSVRFNAPAIPPETQPKRKPSGSRVSSLADYSAALTTVDFVGGSGQGVGLFDIGNNYAELLESPAGTITTDEPEEGLITQRREVRLGGSWIPQDGSGNVVEYQRRPERQEPTKTLYAVIFRITTDCNGQLVDFELAGVVNRFKQAVQVEVPESYIERARIKAASIKYKPAPKKEELLEQYDYFFFCPDYPDRLFTRPRKNET